MDDGALASGTRLGPYEIEGKIGAGGMGYVYRARDPRLARSVALKTLSPSAATDPESLRRFETEAIAAGTLDHPNLLVVFDVGRQDEVSYIVSELLEGETLRARLMRQGPIPDRQAMEIAAQVAAGLAAAHARGIIHRDLKPENIFITRDRRVKILDFGVAKVTRPPEGLPAAASTATGIIVGTVGYMAPEQVVGEPLDHRVDIFALGVVMHEMLSGKAPFQRPTSVASLYAIVSEEAPPLPAPVLPGLAQVVERCLEKRPEARFHSAHDLGLALTLLAHGSDPASARPAIAAGPARVSRRKAITYGVSALGFAAAAGAAGYVIGRSRQGPAIPSFRRLTFRRGLIRSARMAPDGESFLYSALLDGEACRVYTGRLDGMESSPLALPDASILAISRSGELALALGPHVDGVITDGTLARVPMSGGVPRELATGVNSADWSPDGDAFAITRWVDGRCRLEYPVGNVLFAPDHDWMAFARVSPDGQRVAFVRYVQGDIMGRVAVVDRAGTVSSLTGDYTNIHGLVWRGDEVWYTASDDRPLYRALHAVRAGRPPRLVGRMLGNTTLWDVTPAGRLLLSLTDDRTLTAVRLSGEAADRDLSWLDGSWLADLSPDGQYILFNEWGQGGGAQDAGDGKTRWSVYLRRTDGSPAVRIGFGEALALSPDARWALCRPVAGEDTDVLELVPTGPGEVQQVPSTGLSVSSVRFLPDGRRVVVLGREPGKGTQLFLVALPGGQRRAITPEGATSLAVAPDGSAVASEGFGPIRVFPLGASPRDVPGTQGISLKLVDWIHDGLLLQAWGEGPEPFGDVYLVHPVSGERTRWGNVSPLNPAGRMVLGSARFTPDGRSHAYGWHRALSDLYVADGVTG